MLQCQMLGSLSGGMTPEDVIARFNKSTARNPDSRLFSAVRSFLSPQTVGRVICETWRSERGRAAARRLALEPPLDELVRTTAVHTIAEYAIVSVWNRQVDAQQEQLVFDTVGQTYDLIIRTGKIDVMAALPMGAAWKGGFLGKAAWAGGATMLPDDVRGRAAYILGHRFLVLRQRDAGVELLTEAARQSASPKAAELAAADLRLVNAGQGRLLTTNEYNQPTQIVIEPMSGGNLVTLKVPAAGQSAIDLPVGEYRLRLATPREGLTLDPAQIELALAAHRQVSVRWRWKPRDDASAPLGLAPRPATTSGNRQLASLYGQDHRFMRSTLEPRWPIACGPRQRRRCSILQWR